MQIGQVGDRKGRGDDGISNATNKKREIRKESKGKKTRLNGKISPHLALLAPMPSGMAAPSQSFLGRAVGAGRGMSLHTVVFEGFP